MVNFGPPNTVHEKFKDRKFYQHNPTVTLNRTTPEENRELGEEIGRKVATGPTSILIPFKGVSAIDQTGLGAPACFKPATAAPRNRSGRLMAGRCSISITARTGVSCASHPA